MVSEAVSICFISELHYERQTMRTRPRLQESDAFEDGYQWHTSMDPRLYRAATNGDIEAFQRASMDTELSPLEQVSPRRNTVLHLAASSGHHKLVKEILQQCPELANRGNCNDDLALHVAAFGGHLLAVKLLVQFLVKQFARSNNSKLYEVNKAGNTALHVALENHHREVAMFFINADPTVSYYRNLKGISPLCMAAQAGYLELVEKIMDKKPIGIDNPCEKLKSMLVVEHTGQLDSRQLPGQGDISDVSKHSRPGSALPEEELMPALDVNHVEFAEKTNDSMDRSNSLNEAGGRVKSDLGDNLSFRSNSGDSSYEWQISKSLFKMQSSHPHERKKGKSSLHAAIIGGNRDVLEMICNNDRNLINSIDEEGRTPLSFAAYIGYLDGVRYLLDISTDGTYMRDLGGFSPIHAASSKGHIKIVQEFLKRCPDSRELLDGKARNILHVAAKCGKAKMVNYMLKRNELKMLIKERDNQGNTPLHLATMTWHPKVVSILTWDTRVKLELVNNHGRTALDISEQFIDRLPPFRKRLTLMALKAANAPRSENASQAEAELKGIITENHFPTLYISTGLHEACLKMQTKEGVPEKKEYKERVPRKKEYKERVNTLVLVATLVATVTFTAGFTMPGGYRNSGPHEGMATLDTKSAFHTFLICNTIALYSSITVVVALIWAQLGDLNLVLTVLNLALPLLGVALTMLSLAFMVGVHLTVSNLNWLAYLVLVIGSGFVFAISVLFIPLCLPNLSNNYIARYICYYPLCLLIWASRSDIDDKKEIFSLIGDNF